MKTITLPGLIDPHVHLRDPGQTYKEDFLTGTSAALAGGYTTIMDMPNNAEPITTLERLEAKMASAKKQIVCNVGLHFGTLADNFDEFEKVVNYVTGLKVYMNVTTGNFIIDANRLIEIYKAWAAVTNKPILLHAEDDVSETVFKTMKEIKAPTHICHVSSEAELSFVIKAKEKGLPITCGVTPHHLLMTDKDFAQKGAWAMMKPSLKSRKDQDFLWNHLDAIDIIESDHAPHTVEEKQSKEPPFGVPNLETQLSLMLTAEAEGKLSRTQLLDRLHHNPAKIFNIKTDATTKVEVDMSEYTIKNSELKTKCGWSPFDGQKVIGKVTAVYLRGNKVYENGKIISRPGSAQLITS